MSQPPTVENMRVVCAGHINWDVTLRVDRLPAADDESRILERSATGGGSAANAATALASLDVAVRLLGSVGDDTTGERIRSTLTADGIDPRVKLVEGEVTTTKFVLVDETGEVAILGMDGANEALTPDDITPGVLADADALHVTGQRPATAARLADLAADRDIPVSFDPGRRLTDRDFTSVLASTDILFTTDREADPVAGRLDDIPWHVTKYGSDGATLSCPAGTFDHDGFGLPSHDSTGAGDAFAAGFLAIHLAGGDPACALAVANACGAIAATHHGPRPDLSWRRIHDVMT